MRAAAAAKSASALPKARPGRLHRSASGALALTGASVFRIGLQFAMLPILARLVGPSEYGLVAMAMPFILLANVLSDGGMGYALGRQREVTPQQESTVFWLAAAIGAALAAGVALASAPMAQVLNQPRLALLIVALSPILLINSLTTVANGRIIREGRFSVFAAGDLLSTLASTVAALTIALAGGGAWALVGQQLTLWICKLAWVTWRAGAPLQLYFRFEEARRLFQFGVHTIGAILADFASRTLDNLIVGGVLGAVALGYYAMGYQIVRAPDMLISGPLYLYIFTAVSRSAHLGDAARMQDLATAALRLGAVALAPLFCGLALTADLAVTLTLGEAWSGAIMPMRYLSAAGFFFCMCSIMGTTLMGLGQSALRLKLSLGLAVATISAVLAAVSFGLEAVAAAVAGAMALVCGVYLYIVARHLGLPMGHLLRAFGPAAAGSAVMAGLLLAARSPLAQTPQVVALGALVGLGAASYLAVIWLFKRRDLVADFRAFQAAQAGETPEPRLPEPSPT